MLQEPLNKAIKTTSLHLKRLKELGIETVKDFLLYFPMRHTDEREIATIAEIKGGERNVLRGVIKSIKARPPFRGRMQVTTALISDDTGSIEAVWFNQPYLARTLVQNAEVILSGKARYDIKRGKLSLQSPTVERIKSEQVHTARIVPVYHETELGTVKRGPGKISSKWIREKLFPLMPFAHYFAEFLPEEILTTYTLMPFAEAIAGVHFPENETKLEEAKKRLAFNELFLLQLAALYRRHLWRQIAVKEQKQIPAQWDIIKEFTQSLPWQLTNAQKKAIYEIIKDLEKPFPMSRLLEGDTGSGKTIVAAAAALHAVRSGFQVCLIAPTEILARQHTKTFSKLLAPFTIEPRLLLGSTPGAEKKKRIEELASGTINCIVGTHSLLQEKISFKNLGLAIIDEQHRFGVRQREIVKSYGSPHVLSLTATPIPRTLALILYGDQDLSVLDEMPPGRQNIITRIVPEQKRNEAYQWIENEIKKGRQAFIIFPLIEKSEVLEVKAATEEWERLRNQIFPHLTVGLLHGQMQSADKDAIMKDFAEGKIRILVSTAVVEVGVDVPNATIMMIEGAERFGLAQLHQFRGRVGRGSEQSYCFLFPTQCLSETSLSREPRRPGFASISRSARGLALIKRLESLVKYNSGFKLAEIDLQLRGPGEVFGTAQSGIPDLKMALLTDATTIKQTREAAEMLIEEDPTLQKYPELLKKIAEQENIAIDY